MTFVTTGNADRLQFALLGNNYRIYSSSSVHPTTTVYDYKNPTGYNGSNGGANITIDGCGSTPGRNELLVTHESGNFNTFILQAIDITGGSFSIHFVTFS